MPLSLNAGLNTIQLTKGNGYAELDNIVLSPLAGVTPSVPQLAISGGNPEVIVTWPTLAQGYSLQQIGSLNKTNWSTATNLVNLVSGRNQAVFKMNGSNGFFRLYP